MKTLERLSRAFNSLRNSAIGRDGQPRPGVSQELADWIAQTVEAFRGWAGDVPFLIDADDYDHWTKIHNAAAARLTQDSGAVVETLPAPSKPLGEQIKDVASSGLQAAALGIAGVIAVAYLLKKD